MISLVRSFALAGFLATSVGAQSAPVLPTRVDTFTVRYGTMVLGRGITQRSYRGGELVQVYAWRSALDGSWSLDSLFLDGASLKTRLDVLVSGDTTRVAAYAPATVTIRTSGGPKGATTQSIVVPTGTHSSAAIEALAAAMPFSAGASRTISTFYSPPSRLGVVESTIRVAGSETVDGRTAWRVEVDTPGGGTVFWIDAVSRAVLQFDTREGDALITFRR